ncbi:MAG: phosphotransferase [Synergistaceae bacterium]|nr:phosphotransferase [Synergistaceae bacterium]
MREVSIEGCPVIGTGTFGKVYRLDADTVVKVYDDPANLPLIETEQERSRRAFIRGIPTAIPFGIARVGDSYGSMFELIEARNCNDFIAAHPEKADKLIEEYAGFIRKLHAVKAKPGEFPDVRKVYTDYLECIKQYLPEDIYAGLESFVTAVPEEAGLVHGDIQMKNVMLSNGEMMLIDMNTLSAGNQLFEFAGDSRDIQILAWMRFLHVVMIELSSPDSFMIAPTIDKLRRLLDK